MFPKAQIVCHPITGLVNDEFEEYNKTFQPEYPECGLRFDTRTTWTGRSAADSTARFGYRCAVYFQLALSFLELEEVGIIEPACNGMAKVSTTNIVKLLVYGHIN
jgi:hypothetical protein